MKLKTANIKIVDEPGSVSFKSTSLKSIELIATGASLKSVAHVVYLSYQHLWCSFPKSTARGRSRPEITPPIESFNVVS